MPRRARTFIRLVIGAGAAILVAAVAAGVAPASAAPALFAVLVLAMVAAESFVIHLTLRNETLSFSLVEVVATFGLLALPFPAFVLAVSLGVLGGQAFRRRPAVKAAFNVAMYALGASAAGGVVVLLGGTSGTRWLGAVAGMAAFYALNQVLVATIVALVEGQRVLEVLRPSLPLMSAISAGNVSLGILARLLYLAEPATVGLLAVPLVFSFAAYKAWIRSRGESRKMHALYRAGATLTTSLESDHSLAPFLWATKEMFRAEGAEIATVEGRSTLRIVADEGSARAFEAGSGGPPSPQSLNPLESYLASREWRSRLVAPLAGEDGVTGVLVVHDHRGAEGPAEFPKGDAALLQTLANQASTGLSNRALYASVSEERAKLGDIVGHTSDGIYQAGPDRRIITWNPAMTAISGYSAEEAVGQMCFTLLRARDERGVDMCAGHCPILAACSGRASVECDAQIMSKDGALRWIRYSHNPILDGSGAMSSDVVVVRDVTSERAAREAKDDFIASVSHELRTPLTPIKGFLLTLIRADGNFNEAERVEIYERMLSQAARLERLVEDLLDVSRVESGHLSLEVVPVDAGSLVARLVDGYRAGHAQRGFRVDAQGPGPTVLADPGRLEQVLANLVDNALRYAPVSEVQVSVGEEGGRAVIAVRDFGPGIPFEEQERIFDRFHRLGHYLTREQGGTGLGLYIARQLTEAMGGRLTLSSRLGHGSTFSVRLPVAGRVARPQSALGAR